MIKLNENELKGVVYEAVKEYVSEAIDGNEKVLDFINRNGITNSKEFDKVYKKEKYGDYDKDTKVLDYLNAHPDLDTSQKFDRAVFDEGISRAVRSSINNFIKEDSGFEDGLNPEDFEGFGEEEDDDAEDMVGVYTMEDWNSDHSLSPQVGQEIDSEVFYELRDAMKPTTYTKHIFQPGEVYTVDKNYTPLYQTFEFVGEPDRYRYIGLKPVFKKNEEKKTNKKIVKEYMENGNEKSVYNRNDIVVDAFNKATEELHTYQLSPKFFEIVKKYLRGKMEVKAASNSTCLVIANGKKYYLAFNHLENKWEID